MSAQPSRRAAGYYVVQWDANLYVKFVVILPGALGLTTVIYETCVRRWNVVRWLFGMKPLANKASLRPAAEVA